MAREHMEQALGVVRALKDGTLRFEFLAKPIRIHDIAVVGDRDGTVHQVRGQRLDVVLQRRAGRRIAIMSDSGGAAQADQIRLGEHVADEAHAFVDDVRPARFQ